MFGGVGAMSSISVPSLRCAVTPLHCFSRATVARCGRDDRCHTDLATQVSTQSQWTLNQRHTSRLGCPLALADAPEPQLSGSLLVTDCAALVVYGLLASALKAFALAGSDLLSPDFDLAADVASFDLDATLRYVGVEEFAAASLALGWLVGGALSGACSVEWRGLGAERRWRPVLTGWLSAAPLACLCKYGLLAQQQLPVLGRSEQAKLLEAQLAGLTAPNVLADALGMLVVLVLWRRLLPRNDWML